MDVSWIDRDLMASRMSIGDILSVCGEVCGKEDRKEAMYALIFDADSRVGGNAAWVISHLKDDELTFLLPHRRDMMRVVMGESTITIRRLVLSLLERVGVSDMCEDSADFLDYCFAHINDVDTPVGVRSLCVKVVLQYCEVYPELCVELAEQLRLLPFDELSAGDRHIRKKILAKITTNI